MLDNHGYINVKLEPNHYIFSTIIGGKSIPFFYLTVVLVMFFVGYHVGGGIPDF